MSKQISSSQEVIAIYRDKLISYILTSYLADKQDLATNNLFLQFVEKLFAYIPVDYLEEENFSRFAKYAVESFLFFASPKSDKIQVKCSADQGRVTIILLQKNRPFIVDSLKLLLAKEGIEICYLLHPVLYSTRGKDYALQTIHDSNSGADESLIIVEVYGINSQAAITNLESEINRIMQTVELTTASWQELKNACYEVTEICKANNSEPETLAFLKWLSNDHFTFLSYAEYDLAKNSLVKQIAGASIAGYNFGELVTQIEALEASEVVFGKIDRLSEIRRNNFIDFMAIKLPIAGAKRYALFFGLPESTLGYQSVKTIPILRKKMDLLLQNTHFTSNGYNARKLMVIIESLPRDILFQTSLSDLGNICHQMLSAMMSQKLKFFIHADFTKKFVNSLIFIKKEQMSPEMQEKIIEYFSEKLGNTIVGSSLRRINDEFVVLSVNFLVSNSNNNAEQVLSNIDFTQTQRDLDAMTTLWQQQLFAKLHEQYTDLHYIKGLYRILMLIFSPLYKQTYTPQVAIEDYKHLLRATADNRKVFNLTHTEEDGFSLKIYSPNRNIALSELMPAIENLGLKVQDYKSFHLRNSANTAESWLYECKLDVHQDHDSTSILSQKHNIEEALCRIDEGRLAIDSLSGLVSIGGLNWRQVVLVKAWTRYLHQTGFSYGKGYVKRTILQHAHFFKLLVELFEEKFNPNLEGQSLQNRGAEQNSILSAYLGNVVNSSEDKVLRHLLGIVNAIMRTNYYQIHKGDVKNYISFKINPKQVPGLPRPLPFAEIFVFSNEFEAIHLRAGAVSRGGLRWSDRSEDYRLEVLGLMKAQDTKNAVIVPGGAKGAFYLKFSPETMNGQEYMNMAVECYKNFLRGMLDITDNIINGQIVAPSNVICYDKHDPYLVVAADKGTATFSDYANAISEEYNFWLADAFASGGSAGYDHKKMGITSKGAWISVQNHFRSMGIDVAVDPITVVGIGDMSGDVFGNGMLSSRAIRLVAAFNHRHIFIDPSPDAEVSYEERKRLFHKVGSSWSDYNLNLISQGGGIYLRSSKSITISRQAQKLLGVPEQELTPNQLINAILKAEVDLIWNGGIGTYVKASFESNLEIGDKANDEVRCNGKEVRAKVIAEGGNLGLSQFARIEYGKLGGKLNTDFIDNSAGVDCSDHEVNIKIALNNAVRAGKMTLEVRNKLLEEMTGEVEKLVLEDNFKQNQLLNIAERSPMTTTEMCSRLVEALENEGLLDREVEFLPSKEEFIRRSEANERLTRPEHAVILSYSKMSVYRELLPTKIPDDPYCERYLLSYFPNLMLSAAREEVISHSLRREIISTVLTNKLINHLGGTVVSVIKHETGALMCDIIRSYIIVCDIFGIDKMWANVENMAGKIPFVMQIQIFNDIARILRRGIVWFIKNLEHPIEIKPAIARFQAGAVALIQDLSNVLVGDAEQKYKNKFEQYIDANIPLPLATELAHLDSLVSAFDIIKIAEETNAQYHQVAAAYFAVGEFFHIDWLRKCLEAKVDDSYWHRLSVQSIKDDLYDCQRKITATILKSNYGSDVKQWSIDYHDRYVGNYMRFIEDLLTQELVDLNMVLIANKKLGMFLKKI